MIPRLPGGPEAPFPPVQQALREPDGLLAWGGDLSPQRLLRAYQHGIFPWFSEGDPILWWSPHQRTVLRSDEFHCARRLARTLRDSRWQFSADLAFSEVLDGCANSRTSTWITPAMRAAYLQLHALGHAHSFEAWYDGELAGGLYGVSLGRMLFGESMFSVRRDGSKAVLAMLCPLMHGWQMPLLDCQLASAHLASLGARELARETFLCELQPLVTAEGHVGSWRERAHAALAGSAWRPR